MYFSIVTPCYNSTKTLLNSFQSLRDQTYKGFEWILVDDLSTDKTREMIVDIANQASFPVKYYFLEKNYAGAKSLEKAASIASGEVIGVLDHDDQFLPQALEKAKAYLLSYGRNAKIGGLIGRCINENGKLIGKPLRKDLDVCNYTDVRYKQGNFSEMMTFVYTEIIKKYVHVMKPGYSYGILWGAISEKYNFIFVNDVFRVYDMGLVTSYTNNSSNYNIKYHKEIVQMIFFNLNRYINYLHYQPKLSILQASHAVYLILNFRMKPEFKRVSHLRFYILLIIALPLGCLKLILKNLKII